MDKTQRLANCLREVWCIALTTMSGGLNKNVKEKLTKLKVQQKFLTKSCKASVHALKLSNPILLTEITTLDDNLESERTQDKQTLQTKIIEIFEKLQEAESNFNDRQNLKEFQADNCREKLVAIQKKISTLKEEIEKQSYLLCEDEKKLHSEVLFAQPRLEETSYSNKASFDIASSKVRKAKTTQKYPKSKDIATFEKYVERKGVTGGWEENDHLLFLRLRRRHWRGRDAFFSAVQAQLPDLTLELIQEHETWYHEHESLREKHKTAIEIWKANKKEENRNKAANATKTKSTSTSDLNENAKVKAEIEKWKQKRQAQQDEIARTKEQKRQVEEARLKKEQTKKMQMRASIMLYRQQKEKEQQELKQFKEMKLHEEKEEKAAQAKQLIKTFRKLDKLFVEKQKLLRERPLGAETVLPKVAVSVEAKRDPVRVLQPTKVWQTHCKTKPSSFKPIIHLRNMPHLAVPEWRRGIV